MCFPLAIPIAMAVMAAVPSIMGGIGAMQAGKSQAAVAKREGQIQQAKTVFEKGQITAQRRDMESLQRVAAAKGGRTFSGSVLDVVEGSEQNVEMDVLSAHYGGVLGAQSAKFNAKMARAEGRNKAAGQFVQAGVNFGTTLLSGGAGGGLGGMAGGFAGG